jgi:hypothetical protein
MSYKANISVDTVEMQKELTNVRFALARTNWMLRAMGLPADQRKAIMEIQRAVSYIRMLQMIMAGGTTAALVTRIIGKFYPGVRQVTVMVKKLYDMEGPR